MQLPVHAHQGRLYAFHLHAGDDHDDRDDGDVVDDQDDDLKNSLLSASTSSASVATARSNSEQSVDEILDVRNLDSTLTIRATVSFI